MRAVVLHGGVSEVRETADPVPGAGELLVRVLRTAICASDVHDMDHPQQAIDDPSGMSSYDAGLDIVMGHEFVGEVVGHGPDCSDQFPFGTRVTSISMLLSASGMHIIGQHPHAPGSFGELMLFSEALTRAVPVGVPSDAVCEGRLDPLPIVGRVIGLDEVPAALDEARRAEGPLRIIVHPGA